MKSVFMNFENINKERIICVNVTKSYLEHQRPNLYECTRKYWRMNGERAKLAEYVFAICSGKIIGVYKPTLWYQTKNGKYVGRWEFDGVEVTDSPYINMSVAHLFYKRQNPVMYLDM